jgi:hypothetical protein
MTSSNRGKVLLVNHEAHASQSPAVAGALLEVSQPVGVIVRQLLPGIDAAQGIQPNPTAHNIRLAVGRTAVIEKAGRIPHHAPVDVVLVIEIKYVGIALIKLVSHFDFGDLGANVLDDALALSQINPSKAAEPVDSGGLEDDERVIKGMTGFHSVLNLPSTRVMHCQGFQILIRP